MNVVRIEEEKKCLFKENVSLPSVELYCNKYRFL